MASVTGCPVKKDVPKSPVRAPPSQSKYWLKQRLVEAELLVQRGDVRLGGGGAENATGNVTAGGVQQEERQRRDCEDQDYAGEQSPQDEHRH